ncbi:E3 ubiquitin-protein ligase Midline-1-like isoform X2 [Hydractinia symbiolongicarpus]|uniref:E3 ubiquitin-protein ligase Midline-1-like isoform X2 n=1 Tax=Hydractinia symbiolongicarpus TaxID=13093 RepID=UPI002549FA5C|nr:E3 ubiquitin-protein ligase Midline-1-like isoform X2 [Hydractinia symbiolongicarpus]
MAMFKDQLSALLECKICMDTYDNPKLLSCGHTYCKNCLDDILVFQKNGSAEIRCPLKCKSVVTIAEKDTTSLLSTNYSLSDIIDQFGSESQGSLGHQRALCQQTDHCKHDIALMCTTCGLQSCDQCKELHTCQPKLFTTVTFDKKLEEIRPLCNQHNTLAKQVCLECENMFTCRYCINRDHLSHRRKSIAEFSVEAKTWFQSFIETFKDTKVLLERLTGKYNEAFMNLESEREKLVCELEARKLKRVEQYIERLNNENQNLLRKFDKKVSEFRKNVTAAGYTDDAKIKQASDYIDAFNSKADFELVAQKVEIERQLRGIASAPSTVPSLNSNLEDFDDLFDDLMLFNPLGVLTVSIIDISTAGVDAGKKSVCVSHVGETEIKCNQLDLKQSLMDLVECLNKNEKPADNVRAVIKRDIKAKETEKFKKSYTFEEVEKIMENGDEKTLQAILINNPNVVKMEGAYDKSTLLISAAMTNKPRNIIIMLIDAGSDVYAVNKYKWNAYHYSAGYGHQEVLKVLINYGNNNINNADKYGNTPLHLASRRNYIECVKLLLSIPQIDVNRRNNPMQTAYDVTDVDAIKCLLKKHRRKIFLNVFNKYC